jgi:hypothetical protein
MEAHRAPDEPSRPSHYPELGALVELNARSGAGTYVEPRRDGTWVVGWIAGHCGDELAGGSTLAAALTAALEAVG